MFNFYLPNKNFDLLSKKLAEEIRFFLKRESPPKMNKTFLKKNSFRIKKIFIIYNELMSIYLKETCSIFLRLEELESKNVTDFQKIFPPATLENPPFCQLTKKSALIEKIKKSIDAVCFIFKNPPKEFMIMDFVDFLEKEIDFLKKSEKQIIEIDDIWNENTLKARMKSFVCVYNTSLQRIVQLLFFRQFLLENFQYKSFSMWFEALQFFLFFDKFLTRYIETFQYFLFFYLRLIDNPGYKQFISDLNKKN